MSPREVWSEVVRIGLGRFALGDATSQSAIVSRVESARSIQDVSLLIPTAGIVSLPTMPATCSVALGLLVRGADSTFKLHIIANDDKRVLSALQANAPI